MTRIMTPTPTRGPAPSHSPPDVRYAPGIGMAKALGWLSIGLGAAELLAPRQVGQATGVRNHRFLKAYGLREIATGIGILQSPQPAKWMWGRVAGDVLDIATLSAVVADRSYHRGRALAAMTAVAGVTALDALCAAQLSAAAAMEG